MLFISRVSLMQVELGANEMPLLPSPVRPGRAELCCGEQGDHRGDTESSDKSTNWDFTENVAHQTSPGFKHLVLTR